MYTLSDLDKQFSKQKINKAKKLQVREWEEETKNCFVCFVDEENESYDVKITSNAKGEIVQYSCDCANKDFCQHVLAMCLFMAGKSGNAHSNRSVKRKVSEAEIVMANLNSEEIKSWLLDFFKKNKDAEMSFVLDFGKAAIQFTDNEIKDIIRKTIQSVVGKRKNLPAIDVKKLVDLLNKSLDPVMEYILQTPLTEQSLKQYVIIEDEIQKFSFSVYTSSTRIDKFLDQLKVKFVSRFNATRDVQAWETAAKKHWSTFFSNDDQVNICFYNFVFALHEFGNSVQKAFIGNMVKDQIKIWIKQKIDYRVRIKEDLLDIIIENGHFEEVKDYFSVMNYQPEYNKKILTALCEIDSAKVEIIAKKLIDANANAKFDEPYLQILEKIYSQNGDIAGKVYVMKKRFYQKPNIEDYCFIEQNDSNREEFKKFRNQLLASFRNSFSYDPMFSELYFGILRYEKNYKKMLEVINSWVSGKIILMNAEQLYEYNRKSFLNIFKNRAPVYESDDEEKLADFLISKYDDKELLSFFKNNTPFFQPQALGNIVLSKLKNTD